MSRRKGRQSFVACVLFLPTLALGACTAVDSEEDGRPPTQLTTPSPTTTFNGFEAFADEYQRATEDLAGSLPAGVEFPEDPPGEWESDGSFEEGTGKVAAVLQWRCEWASAYVLASDSGARAESTDALDRLAEWSELPDVIDHSDSETRAMWLERVVEPARVGEDTTLRAIQAECSDSNRAEPSGTSSG